MRRDMTAILIVSILITAACGRAWGHQSLKDRGARHILGAVGSIGLAVPIDPDFDQLTSGTPVMTNAGIIYMPIPMLETRAEFVGRRASSGGPNERGALLDVYGGSIGAGFVMEPWILKIDLAFAATFLEARMKIEDDLISYERRDFIQGFSPSAGVSFEVDAGPVLICPGLKVTYDQIPTEDFWVLKQLGGVGFAFQIQVLAPIFQERGTVDDQAN